MKNLFILLFCCTCYIHLTAQTNCPKYTNAIQQGKAFLKKRTPNFDKALIEFQAAQIAARECGLDEKAGKVAAKEIKKVFDGMRKQRDQAIKNEQQAEIAKKQANKALAQVEIEQQKTTKALVVADSLNVKNKKLIDAFYFYDDKFALANKGQYYGFINKEGEEVIGYKYRAAQQFDQETGFAKVKKGFTNRAGEETLSDYLIDTTGQEFKVVYKIEDLNQSTEALDLRDNRLDSFPTEILSYPQLKVVILDQNPIRQRTIFMDFPKEIHRLTALEYLSVNYCQLTTLPEGMGQLTKLRYLDLSTNKNLPFVDVCRAFADSKLKININSVSNDPDVLLIMVPSTSNLPPEIGQLSHLENLDLSSCVVRQIPPEIGNLAHLQYLDLSRNKLSQLPPEIAQLKALQTLDLSDNQLTTLAPEIGQLSNLQSLDLSRNKLNQLAPEIGQLIQLQHLEMGRNQLRQLPPEIGQLKQLEKLYLNSNQLFTLPSEIGALSALQILNLRSNQFQQFPFQLGQLKSLQNLNFNKNQLRILPAEIGQLANLKTLSLFDNQLSTLPPEIGQLTNLQTLFMGSKSIKMFPESIFNLSLNERSWRNIKDALVHHKNYPQAYLVTKKLLDIDSSNFAHWLHLSFYSLFLDRPKEAIAAAQKALDLASFATGVYPNLTLGYLLDNQYEEAEKVYLKWKNKTFSNGKKFGEILVEKMADLEAADIHHPNFEKIKKRFNE